MRAKTLAGILGVMILATSAASADPWTDPAGRFKMDVPHGWRIQPQNSSTSTYIVIHNADRECRIFATPNAQTSSSTPSGVRHALSDEAQWTQEKWVQLANQVQAVFPTGAQFVSQTHDDTTFFPIRRAEFAAPGTVDDVKLSAVHAGLTLRPGVDIMGFCYTVSDPNYRETADNPALFDPIFRSLGTANDATLQSTAEAAAAAAAAPPPAPAPAPAPQQGQHH